MQELPLGGTRVLELAGGTPAAYCARVLSDLGAEVLKVEPPEGDPARSVGPFPDQGPGPEVSGRFLYLAAGKASFVWDGSARSAERLTELAGTADVVLDDGRFGVGSSAGPIGDLVPDEHAVHCLIRPYGGSGPQTAYRGTHLTVFHSGGEGYLLPSGDAWLSHPDRAPVQLGSDAGDYDTGMTAAAGIIAALRWRRLTGRGESVDLSEQEAQLSLNRTRISRFANDGVVMSREGRRYPVGGILACADGFVQVMGVRPEHWARLAELPGCERFSEPPFDVASAGVPDQQLHDALAEWCSTRTRDEVVEPLASVGAPAGIHARAADLLASEQLRHRGFLREVHHREAGRIVLPGPPYRLSACPLPVGPAPRLGEHQDWSWPARPETGPTTPGLRAPLEGVRVVDFTWAAAGPYATLLLALLGAEVIKVETSRRPDPARRGFLTDYGGPERSPNFNELNLNKRSMCADMSDPRGLELVTQLVAVSDVVVDNFRPGVMKRFGLDAETLLAHHPRLVIAASSANGSTGPEAMAAGYASIFGASGGLSEQTGYPDDPPTEIGDTTDYRSGTALCVGILAALEHRDRTGRGQFVDLASREVVIAGAPDQVLAAVLGSSWAPRIGNAHRLWSPQGVFRSADPGQWVAVSITDEAEWRSLCAVLGRQEWTAQFDSPVRRVEEADTIEVELAAWIGSRPARTAFIELQDAGVPASPSLTNEQIVNDPHLRARGLLVEVDHPVIGSSTVQRAPWRFGNLSCDIVRPGPLRGADNELVLEILGVDRSRWEELEEVMT